MSQELRHTLLLTLVLPSLLMASGCRSPYRSDQGALAGGLLGAGTGAIVGNAVGNPGAGAALGAGVGALSGAMIGSELDQIEAENRAAISRQLGREISTNPVTTANVIAMTEAGVDSELIVNHVRSHGVVRVPDETDLIEMTRKNVSSDVIKAMQEPPRQPVIVQPTTEPIIVEEHYYGMPTWGCYHPVPRPLHRRRRAPHGFSWGVSVHN